MGLTSTFTWSRMRKSVGRHLASAAALAAAGGLASCAAHAPPVDRQPAADAVVWAYEVRLNADMTLDVDATFAAPARGALRCDGDAEPFVDGATLEGPGGAAPFDRHAAGWGAACGEACRVHYRVRLGEAAAALGDVDVALAAGGAVFAPPSTWLLRPAEVPARGRFRFRVSAGPGSRFVTGVRPARGQPEGTYEADASALEDVTFAAFGPLRLQRVAEPGVEVAAAPALGLSDDEIARWVRAEAGAIGAYVGRPVDDRVLVLLAPGTSEVTRGKTLASGGASVLVRVGSTVSPQSLLDDWVLAHELVHVAFPMVEAGHGWFGEGLATYVEPIARARAGLLSTEKFWADLVEGLPDGLPAEGDPGLDGSESIGRVYWGGALYFLLADLEIREATRGARSLDDAVRGVIAACGGGESVASLDRVIDAGDRAVGGSTLRALYDRMGRRPERVDLGALWGRLGVVKTGASVRFDEGAQLAAARSAITRPVGPTARPAEAHRGAGGEPLRPGAR
jgi:hypothetical protein